MQPGGGLKSKAFTLIELLAVIVILGVIALIVSPIVINLIEKTKREAWRSTAYGIVESAKMYHDNELLGTSFDEDIVLDFDKGKPSELTFNGTPPSGGIVKINDDGQVSIAIHNKKWCATKKYKDAVVELKKYDKKTCIDAEISDDPLITLIGQEEDYIGQNLIYVDPGAEAKTVGGKHLDYRVEIRKDGDLVDNIDTSNIGDNYLILYIAESNKKMAFVARSVTVIDMTPEITFTEPNAAYVKSQNVTILTSSVFPNIITSFEYKIDDGEWVVVNGTNTVITLDETGEHKVTVRVKDDKGFSAIKESKIYKIDASGPEITINPKEIILEPSEVESFDIFVGVSAIDNVDGLIEQSKIRASGELNIALGEYVITYTTEDSLGNKSFGTRKFIVKDLTKPVITITPNENNHFTKMQNIVIEATDNIKVSSLKYVITKDGIRGSEIEIQNGNTIILNETGIYSIEVIAIDSSNNIATKTSGVYKIDRVNPIITVPENTILKVNEVASYDLKTDIVVSDNSGLIPNLTYDGSLPAVLGNYTVTYTATDEAGNTATAIRKFTIIEGDGPILNFSSVNTGNSWVTGVKVTVTATDQSNLAQFTYEVIKNGTSQGIIEVDVNGNVASTDILLNQDGKYQIKLYARDEYGNESTAWSSENVSNGGYWIDKTPPKTPNVEFKKGSTSGATYTPNTWSTQKIYAILSYTGSDTSGIDYYEYSNDGKIWNKMSSNTLLIDKEGTTNLYFRAVDRAGNKSDASKQYIVKIDTVAPGAPTVTMNKKSLTGTAYTPNTWSNENVYTHASYTKNDTSGIDHYEYSNDGKTWKEGNGLIISFGAKDYYFRVVDKAGNKGDYIKYSIKVDTGTPGPPKISYKLGSTNGATYEPGKWATKPVYVVINSGLAVGDSGLSHYEYSTNKGSTWTKVSGNSITFSKEGDTTFRIRAVNNAGTEGTWTATPSSGTLIIAGDALIKIDTVAPSVPTVAFKKNSTSGASYTPGTSTNTDVYAVLSYTKSDTSGFDHYEYNLASNGTKWSPVAYNYIGWQNTGTSKVKFRVVDKAGNLGKETSVYTVIIKK